jgi:Endonuclease/Exonuclease/phosphatase family
VLIASAETTLAANRATTLGVVRVATWNASLNRSQAGELARDLTSGTDAQVLAFAAIVKRINPDILVVNEFDYDEAGAALRLLRDKYLWQFRYVFSQPSNTGVPSGFDFDNNSKVDGPEDAFGFGAFPGQYGMALLSRVPLDPPKLRTFQKFLWKDMPNAAWPSGWYSDAEQAAFRLSSKSHWDVPVRIGRMTLHLLLSHPTPPSFDGAEDRNGRRNHDEIRLWADYLSGGATADYLYDDQGRRGGLNDPAARFVLLGDMNSDPHDGASYNNAIRQLLDHPRLNRDAAWNKPPSSSGALEAARESGGANNAQRGDPALDTGDFNDRMVGNLRIDYILPSANIAVCGSGIFWPTRDDPDAKFFATKAGPISDHHLVWMDIALSGKCPANYRSRNSMPTGQ